MRKYDYGIVIGRFQPFHLAHQQLIKYALNLSEKVVIVLGSARSASDIRNPFTPKMREKMIRLCFPDEAERLIFRAVRDYPYNDNVWMTEIQNNISGAIEDDLETLPAWEDKKVGREIEDAKVTLIGYFKDRSSYYLNLFPQWSFEELFLNPKSHPEFAINGTQVRESFFADEADWQNQVPSEIVGFLEDFRQSADFATLQKEFAYIRKYKEVTKFAGVSFEATFITTDAVVVQSGHLLVIRRGHQPGKGLLALPGGFLQSGQTLEESALKELKEETRINVPVSVLKGSIKASHAFDYPERSQRGRTVTFAYHIELQPSLKDGLPKVKGGDDAKKAFWLPLSALGEMEEEFFEDHIHIVRYFLGL